MAEEADKTKEIEAKDTAEKPTNKRPRRILPGGQQATFGGVNVKGRRRVQPKPSIGQAVRRSALKKALPYLIAGGSTGLGLGIEFSDLII